MGPKFSICDIVSYNGYVYEVVGIYPIDWLFREMFVYGLIVYGTSPSEPETNMLVVREGLLKKATDRDILVWEILYGKN